MIKYCTICTAVNNRKREEGDVCNECLSALTDPSVKGRIKNHSVAKAVRNMVVAALKEARAAADDADTPDEMVAELQARSQGF